MRALVVYDSVYGNTQQVAEKMGQALSTYGEVETRSAADTEPGQLADLDLLIVGSATQRFSPLPAAKKLLREIPDNGLDGVKVAAFDTRISVENTNSAILKFFVSLFGYAAKPIADRLQKKGGKLVVPPEGFIVEGTEGPMREGELERAAAWAERIATTL
ncbi:MAG: flavodoxin family protein [Anaerolineae bacterium]